MNFETFNTELKNDLANSNASQRSKWAQVIIEDTIPMELLSELLFDQNKRIALRFQWLISDIGLLNSERLSKDLPYLYSLKAKIDRKDFTEALVTYSSIAAIPKSCEVKAIELSFLALKDPETNSTIKSRAINVLSKLAVSYPDLKNEIRIYLEDQLDKNSKSFKKKAESALLSLD